MKLFHNRDVIDREAVIRFNRLPHHPLTPAGRTGPEASQVQPRPHRTGSLSLPEPSNPSTFEVIRMAIAMTCGCGQKHVAPDRSAGLIFTCYRCLTRIQIPAPGEEMVTLPPPVAPISNGVAEVGSPNLARGS
jgi:hypothetical protein